MPYMPSTKTYEREVRTSPRLAKKLTTEKDRAPASTTATTTPTPSCLPYPREEQKENQK